MPRGKRRTETPPVSETNAEEHNITPAAGDQLPPVEMSIESLPVTETIADTEAHAVARRGQFRSWLVDTRRGYAGMTDEAHHCLVLQFAEKPHPDVFTAVKGAGFQYKPDHYGLKNVWVRRNDFEGRLQVESIEKLLRSVSAGQESSQMGLP